MSNLQLSNDALEKWKQDNPEVMKTLRDLHNDKYKIYKAIFKIVRSANILFK